MITLGYGNFAAETFSGRLFCLFFGIIGIPLTLTVLADVGGVMAGSLEKLWSSNKLRLRRLGEKFELVPQRLYLFKIDYGK